MMGDGRRLAHRDALSFTVFACRGDLGGVSRIRTWVARGARFTAALAFQRHTPKCVASGAGLGDEGKRWLAERARLRLESATESLSPSVCPSLDRPDA